MMEAYYEAGPVRLFHGDCVEVMRGLPDASVDAVVTDPPYALEFMGKGWDRFTPAEFEAWCAEWATECLRVLKPGGHLLAFGGSRTWHRLQAGVEDAGFEIRDSVAWLYGSGFPKSLDVSKAIDKAAGAEREVVKEGTRGANRPYVSGQSQGKSYRFGGDASTTAPATDAAREWEGWGTALKPAFEPIVVARKPLVGTVAGNVLAYGTGALNIDACRIPATDAQLAEKYASVQGTGPRSNSIYGTDDRDRDGAEPHPDGRWPTNVVLDASQSAELDRQSGRSQSRVGKPRGAASGDGWGMTKTGAEYEDAGGASRFFPTIEMTAEDWAVELVVRGLPAFRYEAKAPTSERPKDGDTLHPTVKPLALMQWLVRLVTPPAGVVLEPFAGSGTTVEACLREGFGCVAVEREADYLPLILQRIEKPHEVSLFDEGVAS